MEKRFFFYGTGRNFPEKKEEISGGITSFPENYQREEPFHLTFQPNRFFPTNGKRSLVNFQTLQIIRQVSFSHYNKLLAGHWTIKLGIQTADRHKSFQSLVFVLTQLHCGQWSSPTFCLSSLIVQ